MKNSNTPKGDGASHKLSYRAAMATEWSPRRHSGNLKARKLVVVDENRMEFRASLEAWVFYLFFAMGGMVSFILITWKQMGGGTLVLGLGGAAIFAFGIYGLLIGSAPLIFDRGRGLLWRGRRDPDTLPEPARKRRCVPLDSIETVLLVSNFATDGRFDTMYELHLVLSDGRRMRIAALRNIETARHDASKLARFVSRPIMDDIG